MKTQVKTCTFCDLPEEDHKLMSGCQTARLRREVSRLAGQKVRTLAKEGRIVLADRTLTDLLRPEIDEIHAAIGIQALSTDESRLDFYPEENLRGLADLPITISPGETVVGAAIRLLRHKLDRVTQ